MNIWSTYTVYSTSVASASSHINLEVKNTFVLCYHLHITTQTDLLYSSGLSSSCTFQENQQRLKGPFQSNDYIHHHCIVQSPTFDVRTDSEVHI